MTDNESVQLFLRVVRERHDRLKSNIHSLFEKIAEGNQDDIIKANSQLFQSCDTLSQIISAQDHPNWLRSLLDATSHFERSNQLSGQKIRLLNSIAQFRAEALSHTWAFDKPNLEADYNFDDLYKRLKAESKLQALFGSMISTLEQMVSSGEIDSLTALKSLEQLISVIKQNQEGSYFSVMASWEFISSFTKNLIWQGLSDIPGVKQLISAFEKTAKEMNIELESLHTSIATEMKKKYSTTINSLTHKVPCNDLLNQKSSTDTTRE